MKPAPTDALTSLTATVNPDGAPLSAGSVERDRWVCRVRVCCVCVLALCENGSSNASKTPAIDYRTKQRRAEQRKGEHSLA